ncbi:MAG: glycoside-pentoside-hexuronide (GPH):cation symporter [Lachnospiraceae bacterium]|nr:glycoside-pentoside-hexuronide (GPH):cation symporter [Lachnospiraceae bacterium]
MSANTTTSTAMPAQQRLSKKTLFAYGCGDFASNLTNTFIGSYLTIYYTDVVGLTPLIVSVIMLIARIWDAINDPMFGAIAERTNSKKGRFRPYIFYFTPFLALSAVLTFTKVGGPASAIYAAVTYIAYGMLYTVVNLSYGSLSTVMSTNPEDISQLASWRMMGTNLSSVILSAISPIIMHAIAGGEQFTPNSYTITILIFAICQVPLFYFVYANCKEVVKPVQTGRKITVGESIKSVVTNGPLMLIFAMMAAQMFGFFGRLGTVVYYIIYVLQRPDLISVFMSLPSIMTVIGIFLTKNFILRIGKKRLIAIGYVGAGLTLIALYFVSSTNIGLLIFLHALYGFFCFSFPIPMSMVPEAINYQEDKTGVRADGVAYAAVSLSTKIGNAFGPALALIIMGAFGYVANAKQTATAMTGINLVTNLIFGICYLIALIPLYFYPLDEKKNAEIEASLDKKRAANK